MSQNMAVWLDGREAKIFHVDAEQLEKMTVLAPTHDVFHTHPPKGAEGTRDHRPGAVRYFHDIARALEGAGPVLIVGPSSAKLDFLRFLRLHAHDLEERVIGVETVDHPTDRQLVAYAKHYFDHGS
jgi:stalled ribosome rescue protein Dom34